MTNKTVATPRELQRSLSISLSLMLILPPMPLAWKPEVLKPVSVVGYSTEAQPLHHNSSNAILSNNINNDFFVHTTLKTHNDALIQDVRVINGQETLHFNLTLEGNGLPFHNTVATPRELFYTSRERFEFTQKIEGKNILTKEWIYAQQPNVKDGSVYRWRFKSDGALSLKHLTTGAVDIRDDHDRLVAQIQPFEYWTRTGKKSVGQVHVDAVSPGEYMVSVRIQEPLEAYPLAIDPTINYGKWLGEGTTSALYIYDLAYESVNSEIYIAGNIAGSLSGVGTYVGTYNIFQSAGFNSGFVAEVSDTAPPTINWLHHLGGDFGTYVYALAVNGDEIYAGGYTEYPGSWETASFTAGTFTNFVGEGFVVEIADGNPPTLDWRFWLGGIGNEYVLSIAVNGDEIYAGGYTASSASWETAGSTVGTFTNPGTDEGFVVEITDGGPPALAWRVWVGGRGPETINNIVVSNDEIYAVGYSASSGSWETAGSTAGIYTNAGVGEGFLVEIADGGPPSLAFRMWFGGLGEDDAYPLAVNGDEIYVGGSTPSTASWETFGSTVGTFANNGTDEGYLAEIADGSPPTYAWRMWLGGDGADSLYYIAVNGDEIYAAGSAFSSASFETFADTVGTFTNDGSSEGFIVEIADGAPPTATWRLWLGSPNSDGIAALLINGDAIFAGTNSGAYSLETFSSVYGSKMYSAAYALVVIDDGLAPTYKSLQWFSGTGPSVVNALAVNGDEIYVGGKSGNENLTVIADVGTPNITSEGYVLELADSATPQINWRVWLGGEGVSQVYALQVNGDEIYAGGSSASSQSWDTAGSSVGTMTDTSNEGFVAEIADGSPPVLNWRIWLGGSGADEVLALALNGEEIYAGGVSDASGSWETVGSIVGTYTNPPTHEGFVVEIGDGGPPTLDWLMWQGGVGTDRVTTLDVVGDEIYAGGYANSSASFETAAAAVGTFTNPTVNEGFVTEISDGGPPTIAWSMWTGGVGADQVQALAVTNNEIYAGGISASFASWDTAALVVGTFTNNGVNEGFVLELADGSPSSVTWHMWLGGVGNDTVQTLAIIGDEIYAGGYSDSLNSWDTASSTAGTFTDLANNEAFVVEISDGASPTLNWQRWMGSLGADSISALAVNGEEIYVGGYALKSDDMEGTIQGTRFNDQNTAYIFEIADDLAVDVMNTIFFGGE